MEDAYRRHGIDPDTWRVHYAAQRSHTIGCVGSVPGDSLMRTCGSPQPRSASRTVRKGA
jgi:hypothetical protein